MKVLQITASDEELQIIVRALDLYARIGLGQFDVVQDVYDRTCSLDLEKTVALRAALEDVKKSIGLYVNGGPGIHNTCVREEFRLAFDMKQQLDSTRQDNYRISPESVFTVKELP